MKLIRQTFTLRNLTFLAVLLFLAGLFLFGWFQYLIRQNPGNRFTRSGVMSILSKESPVYYSDGQSKLGAFYQNLHRDYMPFSDIPQSFIDAVVSAEDKNFFRHGGADFKGIAFAVLDNIRSLSLKRGGSSLTQQTAKNLFPTHGYGKWNRLKAKLPELVNAYRLERYFSKEEILEFYLNQFYVAGNGHGVSIAAKYFFGKDLHELDLLEIAFIAGSVKGPNKYNPFIARTGPAREKKLEKAHRRTRYVLNKMLENGKISIEAHAEAVSQHLNFQRGKFRYSLSTNMVKVGNFLESPAIQSVLKQYGIDNYMAAGLKIYTTLDKYLQEAAEYAVYRNLSRLDIILNGYRPPSDSDMSLVSELKPGRFYTGRVCSLAYQKKDLRAIQLQFGPLRAWLKPPALERFLKLWHWHETGRKNLPPVEKRRKVLNAYFKPNSPVFCSVQLPVESDTTANPVLDIEQVPLLQGAMCVLKKGRVLVNVGGFGNTGYDRVREAQRQFGSTFKPIVYAAALELGWTPLDTLHNVRGLFRLGPTFYFPRPYHKPDPLVSIAWAGRRSENIASVYLLYHLMDKLDFTGFWRVARDLGCAPETFKDSRAFSEFVRDSLGLIMHEHRTAEVAFRKAVEELAVDLVFEGRDNAAHALKSLPYGWGFARERKKYAGKRSKEDEVRFALLTRCFLIYKSYLKKLNQLDGYGRYLFRNAGTGNIGLFRWAPGPPWFRLPESDLYNVTRDDVLIEGEIPAGVIAEIAGRLKNAPRFQDPYSPEALFLSQEFRTVIGIRFVLAFCRKLGITSSLDPVLSFPLGSNTISLEDAVTAFQTLKDGTAYLSEKTGERLVFIDRIALPNGTVIYTDRVLSQKVISDKARFGITAILRSVVEGGTGRKVNRSLFIRSSQDAGGLKVAFPGYGKTGTTNDHRNGAFLGFIAGPSGTTSKFSPESGYTIGVYSGFDDNTKMEGKSFIGYGSTVSLDAWIAIALYIAKYRHFREKIDFFDLNMQLWSEVSMEKADEFKTVRVQSSNGLPFDKSAGISTESVMFRLRDE